MHFKRTIDAAHEPVTLDDVKAHLRITAEDDDDLLQAYITAARQAAETYTRRSFCTQTWEAAWDAHEILPWGDYDPIRNYRGRTYLELPMPPLRTVSSIVSYASDGSGPTTFLAANYYVDTRSEPGRVALVNGAAWPTDVRELAGLIVTFTAGYADNEVGVPQNIKQGVLMLAAYLFEHRGDENDDTLKAVITGAGSGQSIVLPRHIELILSGAKRWRL